VPRPNRCHTLQKEVLRLAGLGLLTSREANAGHIQSYGGHVRYLIGPAIATGTSWRIGPFHQPE